MNYNHFFHEYQKNSVYNIFWNEYIKYSAIPFIFVILLPIINSIRKINNVLFIILFILPIIIYFLVGIFLVFKRRGEFRSKENIFLKKLLLKYNYYSEKKINYLIQICNEEINKKENRSNFVKSWIMFIIPLTISIIALFKITENETVVNILLAIVIIIIILVFAYQVVLYIVQYINSWLRKEKVDYISLKDELYNVLLDDNFKKRKIYKKKKHPTK